MSICMYVLCPCIIHYIHGENYANMFTLSMEECILTLANSGDDFHTGSCSCKPFFHLACVTCTCQNIFNALII